MPHYENVPFEVPESWVWCKFQDCMDVRDGTHDSPKYTQEGYPLITSKDFKNGQFDFSKTRYISEVDYKNIIKRSKVDIGDILYSMIGGNIGSMIYIQHDNYFDMAIKNVALFKPYQNSDISTKYIAYFLESKIKEYQAIAIGGAQPFVGLDIFRNTLVPLPPLAEQHRIITEIEKWLALIDQIEQGKVDLQTIIKQTKSKILDLAIHGKLVPQDPNDEPAIKLLKRINPDFTPCDNGHSGKLPYKIPRTWVWCSHNSILDISGGSQPAKSYFETIPKPNYIRLYQIRDYGESPVPVYIPINLASKQTEKGDILLARYGGSLGKVFHAKQGAYNVAMVKVIFKFENLIYKEYAYYYYLSDLYQGKLKEISRTAQTGFNITDFNDMYFPLPPINEQQHIVQKIEELFSSLDDIQKSLEV